jgi:hypothetical protein
MVFTFPCHQTISRAPLEAELASTPANILDAPLHNNLVFQVDILAMICKS